MSTKMASWLKEIANIFFSPPFAIVTNNYSPCSATSKPMKRQIMSEENEPNAVNHSCFTK